MAKTIKDEKTTPAPEPAFVMQTCEFPIADSGNDQPNKFINLALTPREARALEAIREGADRAQAILPSGQRVTATAHAIRFILQRVADSMGMKPHTSGPYVPPAPMVLNAETGHYELPAAPRESAPE